MSGVYGTIVVGTDGSATAAKAVDRAAVIAGATDSRLVVCAVGKDDWAQRTASAEVDRLASTGTRAEPRSASGDPGEALVAAARAEGAGLVVVGSRGMTGAGRLFGSVPNSVSHHAGCHVLIVRTT